MANFKYVAVNSNNVSIQGAMESHSRQEVVNSLRERGYYPIEITEESALNKDVELSFLNRVTLKDLSMFCRQFGFAMQAGTPMLRALELSIAQSDNKALKDILKRVREQVQKGRLLSDALKYEDKIPPLMVNMIAAGEASGKLDYVMMELSEYYKKLYKQKQKVSSATMYPKVVLAFAVVVVIFLMLFVVPEFVKTLTQAGAELPLPTKIVIFISNVIADYWFIVLPLIALIAGYKILILNKDPAYKMWASKRSIEGRLFGQINKQILASRFASTFYILNGSGLNILKAIEITCGVLENPFVEKTMEHAREDIKKGNPIGKTIEDLGVFPPMLTQMMTVGEETGSLDAILKKTAEYYEGEAELAIERMITLIEPILIIGLAVVVFVIIAAIMLPMFSMMDAINGM